MARHFDPRSDHLCESSQSETHARFGPTHLSVLQGLLLGIFQDGVGKFGFDSILQSAADVRFCLAFSVCFTSVLTNLIVHTHSSGVMELSIPLFRRL